jgi:hypothetical protein
MARKLTEKATGTITTRIGILSGGEVVALKSVGRYLFLTIDGVQIAERGRVGGKPWVPVLGDWTVTDTGNPLEPEIKRNGVTIPWSGHTQAPGS